MTEAQGDETCGSVINALCVLPREVNRYRAPTSANLQQRRASRWVRMCRSTFTGHRSSSSRTVYSTYVVVVAASAKSGLLATSFPRGALLPKMQSVCTRHPLAVPRQPQTASADLSTKGRYPILTPHLHWNPTGFSRSLAKAPANDRRSPICVLDPEADSAFHQGGERLIKNSCHSPTERLHGFGVHMIQTSRNTYGLASDSPGRVFFTSCTHSPNVSANTVHRRKRSPC